MAAATAAAISFFSCISLVLLKYKSFHLLQKSCFKKMLLFLSPFLKQCFTDSLSLPPFNQNATFIFQKNDIFQNQAIFL